MTLLRQRPASAWQGSAALGALSVSSYINALEQMQAEASPSGINPALYSHTRSAGVGCLQEWVQHRPAASAIAAIHGAERGDHQHHVCPTPIWSPGVGCLQRCALSSQLVTTADSCRGWDCTCADKALCMPRLDSGWEPTGLCHAWLEALGRSREPCSATCMHGTPVSPACHLR